MDSRVGFRKILKNCVRKGKSNEATPFVWALGSVLAVPHPALFIKARLEGLQEILETAENRF
jgi:hypothetical protein